MPRTIGDLISGGVEQAALEGQNGGMMAFLMAMKGVQGIAETIQAMEADSRARKRWDWEQEDRPFETARRKDAEAVRAALAGEGGYSSLSARGKADVDAELERAGSLGSGGLNQFLLSLSASKAGGTTGTGPIDYTNAQALVKNTLEETLANIAFKDADNPKLVKENQLKAIRAAYKTSPQALDETLWNATLSRSRGESDPTSDLVYEALKGHKDMSAAVMGKSKFISDAKANPDATPEAKAMLQQQKMDAANVFAVLKNEKAGGSPQKFMSDKDIFDSIPNRTNKDGDTVWIYNQKERTKKEMESIFSVEENRINFAKKISLGIKEKGIKPTQTPLQEAAIGLENSMVSGVDSAMETVGPYLEEANKQTDATKRWNQLKGFFTKTIPNAANDVKKLYNAVGENSITALLAAGESVDQTLGRASAPGLANYLGQTRQQIDQQSPGTSGWSLDAQHTDVEPRAELSGTYPSLPTNPFEAPGMQPSIAQDPDGLMKLLSMMDAGTMRGRVAPELPSGPANAAMNPTQNQLLFNRQAPSIANDPNGMMLLLKMLMQAQSDMPAKEPKAATKFGKDDQELQNQFKALLQTQGFKTKPKSWNDRAWQPK